MRLPNKGKQCLTSMLYIEPLMNADILCNKFYPAISLCLKAPATLHNLRQFMEYRASKYWTLIGCVGVSMF